ncbi:hypothetical protein EWM64_g495 [Hericium alpestre]|uniref:Uncharacterized protein n=1 Tax=Hericium alpestre TaxID=135208 RepID=A0A4Z0AB00_9AGAM|nr:hypothetical protein EWM64_g495 [Hericium alpestre]
MTSNFSQASLSQMLAYLRTTVSRTSPRSPAAFIAIRGLSSTAVARAEQPRRDDDDEDSDDSQRSARPEDPSWSQWKNTVGKQFEEAHRPRNWLSKEGPFPLNKSFQPPTPVSDAMRTSIYKQFMASPDANSIRNLSARYHMSIKRIEAILRLKGLEEHWIKGKHIQTGFREGMERILGVKIEAAHQKSHEDWVLSRMNVVEADVLDQAEGNDPARARYRRMFWEPVVEGDEPMMLGALEQAQKGYEAHLARDEAAKSGDLMLGHHHDSAQSREVVSETPGRPTLKFVDVGGKFVDPKDRQRRMKESERRARVRAKKAGASTPPSSVPKPEVSATA